MILYRANPQVRESSVVALFPGSQIVSCRANPQVRKSSVVALIPGSEIVNQLKRACADSRRVHVIAYTTMFTANLVLSPRRKRLFFQS